MKTYEITTYDETATYTVTLNEVGVVDVEGLLPETAENLKATVARHMTRRRLRSITALGLAVGPYSHVKEVDPGAVADSP